MRFMASLNQIDTADIVLRGYPYDGTVSYKPGSRFGPSELRAHSEGIETYSPRFNVDIEDVPFFDAGDLELPFGSPDRVLKEIEADAVSILKQGKVLLGIGGEHLISLSLVKAAYNRYPNLHLFHFDAHMDLRDDYLGERLSHATVMKRILDFLPAEHFHQFDIRSGTKEEWQLSRERGFLKSRPEDVLNTLPEDTPIYISVDLDVLDPSIFPGTGTPEPGGLSFTDLVDRLVPFQNRRIAAADLVELAPRIDSSSVSTIVAAKLVRELMAVCHG